MAVYVVEPEWLASPECDAQHVAHTLACLAELRPVLAARGLPLLVRVGSALSVLADLQQSHGIQHLLSHEETDLARIWPLARCRCGRCTRRPRRGLPKSRPRVTPMGGTG